MDRLIPRLVIGLIIWAEVSSEIGLLTPTMFVLCLVLAGGALMLFRWPVQLLRSLGVRPAVLVWPVLVWIALAWWAFPGAFKRFPALTCVIGVAMVFAGAGARYAATRYPQQFSLAIERSKGLLVPACGLVAGQADGAISVLLLPPAVAVVVGLPLRLGWVLIGTVPDHPTSANMGDPGSFHRDGLSDDL